MRTKNLKFTIPIFLSLFLFNAVLAEDVYPPHKLYGTVIYNGQPVPDGVSVVANIDGKEVTNTLTLNGGFGYNTPFYVEGNAEDEINLFVNNIDTKVTVDFCNACYNNCGIYNGNCAPLVLSVTGPVITTTTTTGVTTTISTSGGGGGNGGGTTTTTSPTTTIQVTQTTIQGCQEKWSCTDWSKCENNVQTRTCSDANNCGTDLYKPYESQPCVIEGTEGVTNPLTGLITLTTTQAIVGVITVALIIVIIIGWRIISRRKAVPIPASI